LIETVPGRLYRGLQAIELPSWQTTGATLDEQFGTRRLVLGALVVIVAAWSALANWQSASAEDIRKSADRESTARFSLECGALGGTFGERGKDRTECQWPDGALTACNGSGEACRHTPAPRPVGILGPVFRWSERPARYRPMSGIQTPSFP
jgi:hypothetical protein